MYGVDRLPYQEKKVAKEKTKVAYSLTVLSLLLGYKPAKSLGYMVGLEHNFLSENSN